jgi:hypothetical protein
VNPDILRSIAPNPSALVVATATPAWFSELPPDLQSFFESAGSAERSISSSIVSSYSSISSVSSESSVSSVKSVQSVLSVQSVQSVLSVQSVSSAQAAGSSSAAAASQPKLHGSLVTIRPSTVPNVLLFEGGMLIILGLLAAIL